MTPYRSCPRCAEAEREVDELRAKLRAARRTARARAGRALGAAMLAGFVCGVASLSTWAIADHSSDVADAWRLLKICCSAAPSRRP